MSETGPGDGAKERERRIAKIETLRGLGVEPWPYRFERSHRIAEAVAAGDRLCAGGAAVALAGRIMAIRGHGHTSFG
ncbi:MAG: lysine--tRNA ligase, partial [Candidatus Krumholzibacteria bacterium]|nr:lysine--tRNA ligase [Candidatus Krumholzibacteria bacterium]